MTALTGKNGSGSVISTAIAYQDLSGTATTSRVRTWKNTAGGTATTYTYTYDQRGNILSVKEGTKTTTYVYDAKDQLVRENNQAAGKTWTYAYDAGGNLQTRKEYAYATGTLGAVQDAVTYTYGDAAWKDLLTAYDGAAISYDEIGNPLRDGTWTYTWQRGRQLSSMAAEGQWEKLRQWVEEASPEDPHVPKPSSPDGEPKRMVRITEYRRQDHAYSYDYDAGGNRLAQTETVTTTLRQDRQVYWSAPTPLLPPGGGSAMGTGNMAQGGDDGGVSVNVVGSGFVSHSTVTEEAVTTRYFYSGGTLTDIRHPDYTMHFTYDAVGPATVTYNGTVYYYLRNAQGDVTGLVNAAGQTVVKYAYDAWGNPLAAAGTMAATLGRDNPLRYRGYVYDAETGLYYLKSRYYNPDRGRFINADGYVSTGQGVLGNNMFAYCNSNPIAMRDTEGRYPTYNTMMADSGGAPKVPIKTTPMLLPGDVKKSKHDQNRRPNSGKPGSTSHMPNGDWRKFGPDGRPLLDYDHDDHGQPDKHPHDENGGHYHDWDWEKNPPRGAPHVVSPNPLLGGLVIAACTVGIVLVILDDATGIGAIDDFLTVPLGEGISYGVLLWCGG